MFHIRASEIQAYGYLPLHIMQVFNKLKTLSPTPSAIVDKLAFSFDLTCFPTSKNPLTTLQKKKTYLEYFI